jgi:hypothetical protein
VYENLDASGRARLVHPVAFASSPEQALELMLASDFDPRVSAVLETDQQLPVAPPSAGEQALESVRIRSYAPEQIELEANLTTAGYLILSEAAYPGWRASVDGEEVEIVTADLLFQAVWLEAGRHRVQFTFTPGPVWAGAIVSALGLLLLLASPFVFGKTLLADGKRPPAGEITVREETLSQDRSAATGAFAGPE